MRIAIIGPEASGKTELASALAKLFDGVATEEYARQYFAERLLPADYTLSKTEMQEVMQGQSALEAGEGRRFIDASCIHGPLYSAMRRDAQQQLQFDFSAVDSVIMDYALKADYDGFILCRPHPALQWVYDGARAMPDYADRVAFADGCAAFIATHYADKPCIVVDAGEWGKRTQQAVEEIKRLIGMI